MTLDTKRLCVCGHPYDYPYHHPDPSPLRDSTCAGCGCRSRRLAPTASLPDEAVIA